MGGGRHVHTTAPDSYTQLYPKVWAVYIWRLAFWVAHMDEWKLFIFEDWYFELLTWMNESCLYLETGILSCSHEWMKVFLNLETGILSCSHGWMEIVYIWRLVCWVAHMHEWKLFICGGWHFELLTWMNESCLYLETGILSCSYRWMEIVYIWRLACWVTHMDEWKLWLTLLGECG